MFFAPPKVKSLSRYAEYGAYLGNRHFLVMLGLAITMHLGVIAIYSMRPRMEIIRIPVRVLNIKLTNGDAGSMAMPAASQAPPVAQAPEEHKAPPPAIQPLEAKPEHENKPPADKGLAKTQAKPVRVHLPPVTVLPGKAHTARRSHNKDTGIPAPEFTFATPKQYVRQRDKEGTGNGSVISGDAGGKEVIQRYTETISQWIKNHQMEARERCAQAKEVTGECDAKGDVVVRLRIDRDGHILNNSVDKTSGKELVDQLAMQTVRASDPVPAVPSNYPSDSQLEFLIPVRVDLSAKQ